MYVSITAFRIMLKVQKKGQQAALEFHPLKVPFYFNLHKIDYLNL